MCIYICVSMCVYIHIDVHIDIHAMVMPIHSNHNTSHMSTARVAGSDVIWVGYDL